MLVYQRVINCKFRRQHHHFVEEVEEKRPDLITIMRLGPRVFERHGSASTAVFVEYGWDVELEMLLLLVRQKNMEKSASKAGASTRPALADSRRICAESKATRSVQERLKGKITVKAHCTLQIPGPQLTMQNFKTIQYYIILHHITPGITPGIAPGTPGSTSTAQGSCIRCECIGRQDLCAD